VIRKAGFPFMNWRYAMKKIVVLIVAAALVFGALNFHFIFLGNNLKVLKKTTMTFEDTFIDARGSKKFNLLLKPALVEAGIKDLF